MTAADPRADWLEWRRTGTGASDIAAILNLSPWGSPFSVWASKTDQQDDDHDTPAMEFGRRAEVMVAPWFTERTGLRVTGEQTRCSHPDRPWMLCTVDGFVFDGPSTDLIDAVGVLEIKTTSDSAAEWADGPPVHYRCQATWAMAVTGLDRCWFAVLHLALGRPDFQVYEFQRDPADETYVVETVTRFWHDHILTGTPPDVDAHPATGPAIKAHWPTGAGTLDANDEARTLIARLNAHKAAAARLANHIEAAENQLRALLGDREALIDGYDPNGRPNVLASWKPQDATRLDSAALKTAHPSLWAEFANTTTTRVLRVTKPKGE